MSRVTVKKGDGDYFTRKMMTVLAVSLGVLTSLLLLVNSESTSITGYNVLRNVYGGAASLVLVVVLVLVIILYLKVVQS